MYAGNPLVMNKRLRKVSGVVPTIPSPSPIRITKATPWSGRFAPKNIRVINPMGGLGEDETIQPIAPRGSDVFPEIGVAPTIGGRSIPTLSPVVEVSSGPSIWDSLFSGVGKVVGPAAQALVGIKANETVQQAQQRAMAATWNPYITGPALQAQAYQNAYAQGTGAAPMFSTGTMLVLGLGALGLVVAMSRR